MGNKHHVQIIDNHWTRPDKDGKYFPILAQEVLNQDEYSSSSWYNLSDEAYEEWLLCQKMWEAEKVVQNIQNRQRCKEKSG